MPSKLTIARARLPLADRFWNKVRKTDGCWFWKAAEKRPGYGRIGSDDTPPKTLLAHRVAWELTNGPIPEGMIVLHNCDNPVCVRPDHLRVGTFADNTHDMLEKNRGIAGDRHPARIDPTYLRRGANHPARIDSSYLVRGEAHPNSKLTDEEVSNIRQLYAAGGVSQKALAQQFGVSETVINRIARGRR